MVGLCVLGSLEISPEMTTVLTKGEGMAAMSELKDTLTKELPGVISNFYHEQGVSRQALIGQEVVIRIEFLSIEQGVAKAIMIMSKEGK